MSLPGLMFAAIRVLAGPLLGALVAYGLFASEMPFPAAFVAGLAAWMAFWWVTEAVSIEVTSLLPIIVLPFAGIYETDALSRVCAPYADKNVFFFLGGFGLGLAIERTHLHRMGALYLLKIAGTNASLVVGAFMLTTTLISLWVSNTATTMLMIPLAMSVVAIQSDRKFAAPLLIGIAFASSIGGMATIVGTAPNIFFAGFMARDGKTIQFLDWFMLAGPISVLMLIGTWFWLTWILFPIRRMQVAVPESWGEEMNQRKGLNRNQVITLIIFFGAAGTWMFKGSFVKIAQSFDLIGLADLLKKIEDPWVAMTAMLLLLLVPFGKPILAWKDVQGVPWGVLILMGGGLSLAQAIEDSGLDQRIAGVAGGFAGLSTWLVLTLIVVMVILVSELASNTATATALIPILSSVGPALGIDQLTLLSAVVLASSCGFMLPVATPPNTLVYAQGKFPASDMIRAGAVVNLMAVALIPIVVMLLRPLLGT